MYIDTHAHLTDERFDDYKQIISNMENDNLKYLITVGCDYGSSLKCYDIANENKNVFCAVGVHPHDASTLTDDMLNKFANMATCEKVVAIGEIGLDYYYNLSPQEVQKQAFMKQLELASQLNLPVILHVRDAYLEAYNMLKANAKLLNNGGVMHCYSGSAEMVKDFLALGLFVSFSGSITFKGNKKAMETVCAVPLNKVLSETDCPYLTPMPHRGETNYPKYVGHVTDKMAEFYGIPTDKLQEQIEANAKILFKRIK